MPDRPLAANSRGLASFAPPSLQSDPVLAPFAALAAPNFNAESYAREVLSLRPEEKVKAHLETMCAARDHAADLVAEAMEGAVPALLKASHAVSVAQAQVLKLSSDHRRLSEALGAASAALALQTTDSMLPQPPDTGSSENTHAPDLFNQFDLYLSERLFQPAVATMERLKHRQGDANPEIQDRLVTLRRALENEIKCPALKNAQQRTLVGLLARIGDAAAAQDAYLEYSARMLRNDVRRQLAYGASAKGVADALFEGLDTVAADYQACFVPIGTAHHAPLIVWAARMIAWAAKQTDRKYCLARARSFCLRGIDLGFIVRDLLPEKDEV